jgi:hypothetical protein
VIRRIYACVCSKLIDQRLPSSLCLNRPLIRGLFILMASNEQQGGLHFLPEFAGHSESELSDLFEEFDSGQFIRMHRQLDDTKKLDVEHSAETIGAKVKDLQPPYIKLATLDWPNGDVLIQIHPEASVNQRRFLAGHEFGHYGLFLYYFNTTGSTKAYFENSKTGTDKWRFEAFCDYFALRMNGFSMISEFTDWDNFPEIN